MGSPDEPASPFDSDNAPDLVGDAGAALVVDRSVPEPVRLAIRAAGFSLAALDAPDALAGVAPLSALDDLPNGLPRIAVLGALGFTEELAAQRAGAVAWITDDADAGDVVAAASWVDRSGAARPRQVLLVEDQLFVAQLVARALTQQGHQVAIAASGAEAFAMLEDGDPDALIVDLTLPDCNGAELVSVIRHRGRLAATPILYLSGEADIGRQRSALLAGGDGFLKKPAPPPELVRWVETATARRDRLLRHLRHDGLTGLLVNAAFREALARAIAAASRTGTVVSVGLIDVDHFKKVNDTHGHGIGDQVLRRLGRMLRTGRRAGDAVGRLGGEEMAILLPGCDAVEAQVVVDGLRRRFGAEQFEGAGGATFAVTFSSGIACSAQGATGDRMLRDADVALYRAKHEGRNRVVLAE